jgi:serine/threonine protein kinase
VSEGSPVVPGPPGHANGASAVPSRSASLAIASRGPAQERARNPSFHPGARIAGEYVVERLIGEGSLGVVVAARHIQFDQNVAIKYLRPAALETKGAAEYFLHEARRAAKLQSEHVVHIYDVGTLPDGAPYVVMECLSGSDLRRMLSATGPLPVDRAVDYVLQACKGLAEAHAAGVVHRDIKPGNLFLATSFGGASVLKVLDFGISKAAAKITADGGVAELAEACDRYGTLAYMSPEQLVASATVDARTDVWAMGVVLYELLTGALPFEGDSIPDLCTAILHQPPIPLLNAGPDLPARLESVVGRCLTKDVWMRFQSVTQLAHELQPFAAPAARRPRTEQASRGMPAGDPLRASTPPPPSARVSVESSGGGMALAEPVDRFVTTTGAGVESWAPDAAPKGGARHRPLLVIALSASVVTAALAIAALTGARSSLAPTTEHAAVPAPEPAASPAANPEPQPANPQPALAPPTTREPPVPVAGVANPSSPPAALTQQPSRGVPRRAPPPRPAVPTPAKTADRPSQADPNAVINPFE